MARGIDQERTAIFRVSLTAFLSTTVSVGLTYLAMEAAFGTDPSATISVADAKRFGMIIAAIMPLLIAPPLSYWLFRFGQQLRRARGELEKIARTDQLTGLLNRRGFDEATIKPLAAARAAGAPVAALMIDVDHFKGLNDSFGHEFGDRALVHVAGILSRFAGEAGIVAGRQGGDEFAMLLANATAREAKTIAEKIRAACAETVVEAGLGGVAVSIGVAVSRRSGESLPALMGRADAALYEGKRAGRNRVVVAASVEPVVFGAAA